jgi:hypothetical protein
MPNEQKPKKLITGDEGVLSSTRETPDTSNSNKDNNLNKQPVSPKKRKRVNKAK